MLKPYKIQMIVIFLLMLAASTITLLNPEIQKYLIDDILNAENSTLTQAFICLGIMFSLSIGIIIVNISKSYLCARLGSTISMDLRSMSNNSCNTPAFFPSQCGHCFVPGSALPQIRHVVSYSLLSIFCVFPLFNNIAPLAA